MDAHGVAGARLARRLLAEAPRVILDADALNVFRDDPGELSDHAGELVLTPHARELARIGGGEDGGTPLDGSGGGFIDLGLEAEAEPTDPGGFELAADKPWGGFGF